MWSILWWSPPVQLWYFDRTGEQFVGDPTKPWDPPPSSSGEGSPLNDGRYDHVSPPTSQRRWCCSSWWHPGSCWSLSTPPDDVFQHPPQYDESVSCEPSIPPQHRPPMSRVLEGHQSSFNHSSPGIQASLSWVGNEAWWWFHAWSLVPIGVDDHLEHSNQGPPCGVEKARKDH